MATLDVARKFLEEVSDPRRAESVSCPVYPCLRNLRPGLLAAQHLLDEVGRPLSNSGIVPFSSSYVLSSHILLPHHPHELGQALRSLFLPLA